MAPAVPFVPFMAASLFSKGGVRSPAGTPGKESDWGEVKALACWAVEGCVVRDSMIFDDFLIVSKMYELEYGNLSSG
jgi:hypothetical protein